MFRVDQVYDLTFFAGTSEGTVRRRVRVIEVQLPLLKVRDAQSVETIVNTHSAAFASAKVAEE